MWSLVPGDSGWRELEGLATRQPPLNTVHSYLSFIDLVKDDIAAYVEQRKQFATLAGNQALTVQVARESAAFSQSGADGVLRLIATASPVPGDPLFAQGEWQATVAAGLGDRDRLLSLF